MGDEWHESKPQVSGRERHEQARFCRLGHSRRGTAEENAANEKFTTPFRRGQENQTSIGRRQQWVHAPGDHRPWPLAVCRALLACGTAWTRTVEGLVACAGPES